jgi:adenine-specific DNA methylase
VEVVYKWCGGGIQMVWRWYANGAEGVYKWCRGGIQMVWRWYTNGVEVVYKWCGGGIQMVWRWYTNGVEGVGKWCGRGTKEVKRRSLEKEFTQSSLLSQWSEEVRAYRIKVVNSRLCKFHGSAFG